MPDKPQKLFFKHILRKVFLEDWPVKLLALVITLTLWFAVTGLSTPTTKRLTIPLNLNISSNAQVTNAPQQEVDIEIIGDKRKVEQINRADLLASIDLTEVQPGDRVIPLTPETVFVALPQGVKLVEVQPSRIAVKLEAVEEKDVEVRVDTSGAPATGFEIYTTSVLPQKIRVRGPASIVSMLTYVQTERIDLTGRNNDLLAKQVAVTSPDAKAAVLNTFVDVTFKIGEKRIERPFRVSVLNDAKEANFIVYAPRTLLLKARPEDFTVEMVLGENGEETPQVTLPSYLQELGEIRNLKISGKRPLI